jgi:hypothetical protein
VPRFRKSFAQSNSLREARTFVATRTRDGEFKSFPVCKSPVGGQLGRSDFQKHEHTRGTHPIIQGARNTSLPYAPKSAPLQTSIVTPFLIYRDRRLVESIWTLSTLGGVLLRYCPVQLKLNWTSGQAPTPQSHKNSPGYDFPCLTRKANP